MFTISKNTYQTNGICLYENDNGDSVFCKRTQDGFIGKLRFADKRIRAESLHINIPIKDEVGTNVNLSYDGDVNVADYQGIIEDFFSIIHRWISMCYDLEIIEKTRLLGQPIHDLIKQLENYDELGGLLREMS